MYLKLWVGVCSFLDDVLQEYVLRVQRGLVKENSWLVHRRYNDFVALHKYLCTAGLPLSLPAKKLFGNLQPEFVARRLDGLQQYLDVVLMNPILASSLTTRRFVDPEQYNQSFSGKPENCIIYSMQSIV